MARFYGRVQGSRGPTYCLGGSAGLNTVAASWHGAVSVWLYVNDDGVDCCRVNLIKWNGAGTERKLYDGPIAGHRIGKST